MDKKKKIIIPILAGLLVGGAALGVFFFFKKAPKSENSLNQSQKEAARNNVELSGESETSELMETIKSQGCVADGLLFGYKGKDNTALKMIDRSNCRYLHRAVETWLSPPDFDKVAQRKKLITKPDMLYGMFIAEAIDKKANYYYPAEDRDFDFSEMCRSGSDNFWGEHTCKPYFGKSEYQKYLQYITEQAIDNGVQVFLFGQIFYQENSDLTHPFVKDIIRNMREYAAWKGVPIVVGAQTNDITDENYLRLFDFIEGGVGLTDAGTVENGPCFSRWWNDTDGGWCWALLWNKKYVSRANDVVVHLDWSGRWEDDMSVFTRMDKDKRAETLAYLHNYFLSRNVGFLLPMLTTIYKNNGGCYGDKAKYYSADKNFSCQDEDAINVILKNQQD